MGDMCPPPLEDPADIANAALDAVEAAEEHVYPGVVADGVSQGRGMEGRTPADVFVRCLPKPKRPKEDKIKKAA